MEIGGIGVGVVREITGEKQGDIMAGLHTAVGLNSGCRNQETEVIALCFESCKRGWI